MGQFWGQSAAGQTDQRLLDSDILINWNSGFVWLPSLDSVLFSPRCWHVVIHMLKAHKELTLVHIELITREVGPVTCTHDIYDVMWTFTSQPFLRGEPREVVKNSIC